MLTPENIREAVERLFPSIVAHRRYLHAHPELSFREYATSRYLTEVLDAWGIPYKIMADTGIVAHIEGQEPEAGTIALRADIDALPITEATNAGYASQNPGVMHACGHDVHTASMLGVAALLNENKQAFRGTFKILFQPGEEQAPGGANKMMEGGGLQDPVPQVIFGQHVHPDLPAGKVGMRSGPFMASSDEINITVHGKGGHAAMPGQLVDPVLVASHLVVGLQQLVSRWSDPNVPTVLSFGRFIADGSTNVIPDTVSLAGTFRTFDEAWRKTAHKKLRQLAENLAHGMGAKAEVTIRPGYPALINHDAVTQRAHEAAVQYLGKENVHEIPPRPTAEDFAFYLQQMPGCFYRLGIADPADPSGQHALHTSRFDVDESSLKPGMGLMAYIALQEMAFQIAHNVENHG